MNPKYEEPKSSELLRSHVREIGYALTALLVPFGVRLIPEAFSYPYPIGFDTIGYYIPIMQSRIALLTSPSNFFEGT